MKGWFPNSLAIVLLITGSVAAEAAVQATAAVSSSLLAYSFVHCQVNKWLMCYPWMVAHQLSMIDDPWQA